MKIFIMPLLAGLLAGCAITERHYDVTLYA